MRALVSGATGFIGRRLVERLDRPAVLSRDPERSRRALGAVDAFAWDARSGPPPAEAMRGVEAVFHLAGEPIADSRWSDARKSVLRESRVTGTRHLVDAIAALPVGERPRVLVSGSAVGYYGSRGDQVLDESSSPGDDFLARLCRDWEAEAMRARELGVRVALVRTGLVLGAGGGVLARMLPPFRLGLGGRLGDGRQWMPWIHLDDEVGLLLHAAEREEIAGPMNAVGPSPVQNREFTRVLAETLHRPAILPVPTAALRLAFGELSEALLSSQRALPRVAERTGYRFLHPDLAGALRALLDEAPGIAPSA